MNMISENVENQIANFLKVIGSGFRVKLLYSIGFGEACVCHLETVLNTRQAYISQHLMVLRDAGILETRRDGKYIYYRIADQRLFTLFESAAAILDLSPETLAMIITPATNKNCECPRCEPEFVNKHK